MKKKMNNKALSSFAKTLPKRRPIERAKHKNLDTFSRAKKIIKKYPGFTVALIFSAIIIFLLATVLLFPADPALQEKLALAEELHKDSQEIISGSLANVIAEIDGTYEDVLEDDYLMSMKHDLEWMEKKENEIYFSSSQKDTFAKEIAFRAIMNIIIELNNDSMLNILDFGEEYTITLALEKTPPKQIIPQEDINEAFVDNEYEKEVFMNTFDELLQSYFDEKKEIIRSNSIQERRFVEANKLILLSYS
jgi:hypothetical protein